MKTQNLIYVIFLSCLFLFASCSSNDDGGTNTESNLFIGIWKPIKDVDVCSTGSEDIYSYPVCEQNGKLTINADGNFDGSNYYEYSNTTCEVEFSYSGTWQITNDNLSITIDGDIISITFFEVSKNTLRLGMYEVDPEYTCDGDNLPSHYYTEYTRI